jgi:hypothetical protein
LQSVASVREISSRTGKLILLTMASRRDCRMLTAAGMRPRLSNDMLAFGSKTIAMANIRTDPKTPDVAVSTPAFEESRRMPASKRSP